MSTALPTRRRQVQRSGLAGIGATVLFVGIASPAAAATDVVIPLAPSEVLLFASPVENGSAVPMDPSVDPATGAVAPVPVEFTGSLTVDLPAGLDSAAVEADLVVDDNDDGIPEATYSSAYMPANPRFLAMTGQGSDTITITLPADDPAIGDDAYLSLQPLTTTYDPTVFTFIDPVSYDLALSAPADPLAPAAVTVAPELVALATVPCALTSGASCPVAVTAGDTLVLDLTADSALRVLGLTDLTGSEVALQSIDDPTAAPVLLTPQVNGSTATAALPADLGAGPYGLVLLSPTMSGLSIVLAELDVAAAPVVAQAAAPVAVPAPPPVNAGLHSNTGVTAPADGTGSPAALAGGAGLLLLAGAGGVAVARTRRRPAAGTGTGEA